MTVASRSSIALQSELPGDRSRDHGLTTLADEFHLALDRPLNLRSFPVGQPESFHVPVLLVERGEWQPHGARRTASFIHRSPHPTVHFTKRVQLDEATDC